MKDYCGFVAPYFGGAAAALAAAASVLAIPPASPFAAPLGAMAGLLGAEAFYCRLIAVDPVSEDYTQLVAARRLNVRNFVSITAENVDFIEDIIPWASHILSTLSFLEAIAGTMDRALYARSIDVEEMYFAQLRSSQGYSRAAAASLRSGQETRLRVVERLDQLRVTEGTGLTLEDQRRDLARQNRMWNALMAAGLNPWNIRPEGREIIISYDGVLEAVERWRTEGIDAPTVNSVHATGISSEGAESIFNSLREWPTREQFDISIARILESPTLTGTELGLAEKLNRWANYRGD